MIKFSKSLYQQNLNSSDPVIPVLSAAGFSYFNMTSIQLYLFYEHILKLLLL